MVGVSCYWENQSAQLDLGFPAKAVVWPGGSSRSIPSGSKRNCFLVMVLYSCLMILFWFKTCYVPLIKAGGPMLLMCSPSDTFLGRKSYVFLSLWIWSFLCPVSDNVFRVWPLKPRALKLLSLRATILWTCIPTTSMTKTNDFCWTMSAAS